jgi:hypothetical protein
MVSSEARKQAFAQTGVIVLLSAIGFNQQMTEAHLCAGYLTHSPGHPSFSMGWYILLAKENNIWVIKKIQDAWIT